jgi:hypothetical protein
MHQETLVTMGDYAAEKRMLCLSWMAHKEVEFVTLEIKINIVKKAT